MKFKEKHIEMYMRFAIAAAETSSCTRLKVGAVAVKGNRAVGTGYNGLATGVKGECEVWVEDNKEGMVLVTRPEVRHAEKNLLLNIAKSTESAEGCAIFCTHSCCYYCALDLVDAGISQFYYLHEYRCNKGLTYLRANGVEVFHVTTPFINTK